MLIPPFAYLYIHRPWWFFASLLGGLVLLPTALHHPWSWPVYAALVVVHATVLAYRHEVRFRDPWYARPIGLLLCLCLTTTAGAGVRLFALDIYRVASGSMIPSLAVNDLVFAKKWGEVDIERGRIYLLSFEGDNHVYVKRLVGVPGDTVTMRGNAVSLNGELITQDAGQGTEGYQFWESLDGNRYPILDLYNIQKFERTFVLGEDEHFFLGDNRSNSTDSRIRGPVSGAQIIGAVTRVPRL
ncbi:MAG: signal peptidase I [Pseudomonadota bacterium]